METPNSNALSEFTFKSNAKVCIQISCKAVEKCERENQQN